MRFSGYSYSVNDPVIEGCDLKTRKRDSGEVTITNSLKGLSFLTRQTSNRNREGNFCSSLQAPREHLITAKNHKIEQARVNSRSWTAVFYSLDNALYEIKDK